MLVLVLLVLVTLVNVIFVILIPLLFCYFQFDKCVSESISYPAQQRQPITYGFLHQGAIWHL